MKGFQIYAATAAFVLSFALQCIAGQVFGGQSEQAGKERKVEVEASRAVAGLSLMLEKAAEQQVDVVGIIAELYEEHMQREREINLLAEVIYHENWHTDKEKLTARYTGAVVMNRVNSPEWPDSVESVLYQKGQYSTTKKFFTVQLPDECYDMARDIYVNGTPDVPEDIVFQATFKQGKVWKVINGEYFCYG